MDKRSNVSTIVVVSFLVLLFAGEAQASFKKCLGKCIIKCFLKPDKLLCGAGCLAMCIIGRGHPGPASAACSSVEHSYCKLGCAMDKCSYALSSGIGVESLVETLDNCVNTCGVGDCGRLIPADGSCTMLED